LKTLLDTRRYCYVAAQESCGYRHPDRRSGRGPGRCGPARLARRATADRSRGARRPAQTAAADTQRRESQATDDAHRVEPLRFEGDAAQAFARLRELAARWPGAAIVAEAPGYFHAEFSTRWLRFVDDVEFHLDPSGRVIQVRSASRLGHSDLGTNRRRVEAIRQQFGGGAG
jgi:uncharacterized protein (DUF1499 family)